MSDGSSLPRLPSVELKLSRPFYSPQFTAPIVVAGDDRNSHKDCRKNIADVVSATVENVVKRI